jgi:hypothetical protein
MANPNVKAAVGYFAERKLFPDSHGFTEIKFRVDNSPDFSSLFFIPFEGPNANAELKHLALLAETPKNSRVLLGEISAEATPPEVREEKIVVEGKIEPGKGQLKSWLKCSAVGCVPAGLGCFTGGAAWLPCFCLWCGGAVVACGLNEILFP